MPLKKFEAALNAIDWKKNVNALLTDSKSAQRLTAANLRLAVWARQFEMADRGNPALSFVREMQISGQHVAVLTALSLYKPAAGSMRAMVESALYYTYCRTHPSELETQARGKGFYIEKREVVDFHKEHTIEFNKLQQKLGLVSRLEKWYGQVSSLVHGHIPGAWIEHKSVAEIRAIKATQDLVLSAFVEGGEIVHRLFLCTTGRQLWDSFSPQAKGDLLLGLHGNQKKALGIDAA
jgi:hypothetical protein